MRIEHWVYTIPLKLRSLVHRSRLGEELDEELRDHVERQTEANLARGMSAEEARRAALRAFGNPVALREQTHDTWSWSELEQWARDLRIGARTLRRTPGFTIVAILIMALGIGANVALFTVVRGIVLKPLPFADPGRLVMLYESRLHDNDAPGYNLVAGGIYSAWKKDNQTFSSLGLVGDSRVLLSGSGGALSEKLDCAAFSWDLLPTLGVEPALGRNFTEAEDSLSGPRTVLLSWALWQRRFGGGAGIVNHTVYIDALPYTVIGVMPAWFEFPDSTSQLWLSAYNSRPEEMMQSFSDHTLGVVGRLKPGVSQAQAIADLSLISRHIHNDHLSDPFIFLGANSRTLLDHMVGDMKTPLYLLLAATGCVLLIACLNVANLLVARAAARRKDLAIRTALGGGWGHVLRERLVESLLLSAAGGAVGCGFAQAAIQWLVRTRQDLNRIDSIHMDGAVAAFAIALVALCAVGSGIISIFGTRHESILRVLLESSRTFSGDRAKANLRRVLLSAEVSLTVILLIGAGLLLRSYERLRTTDPGCLTKNVLTMRFGLPDARYGTPAKVANFYDDLLSRIRELPGVSGAGFVDLLPGRGYGRDGTFTIVEHPPLPQGKGNSALARTADPTYFQTIGIPVLRGRTFNPSLRLKDANEMVIDQPFADTWFRGEDPVGRHIETKRGRYVIVGVVGATRFEIGENPRPMMYTSMEAGDRTFGAIVVRSSQDVGQFALPIERIVAKMDPDNAVSDVLTMNQVQGQTTLDASFTATLLTAFAMLSLLLAAAGLFGVLSYMAAQRTTEIGIRVALGAQREQVLWLMLRDGMGPALAGLVLGLAGGAAAAQLLRGVLYRTQSLDPAVFLAAAGVLFLVAVAACALPAWRASRLDPLVALRYE